MGLTPFADPAILSHPMTTEGDRPDVSVVLSTYNRAHVLPRALDSLLDQDHDHARYEVIAVDNNSTDGTREHIESFSTRASNLRYVFEAKQGLSHARNAGILAARAPLIAFTDDDVRVGQNTRFTADGRNIEGRVVRVSPTIALRSE